MQFINKLFKTFIPVVFLFAFTLNNFAANEFRTEYDVRYEILENWETLVTQEITITNLKNDVVATNYTLTVKQMEITDIEAIDQNGKMGISEEKDDDGSTTIRAKLNENIIGKDRVSRFTFKYKTKDIAHKVGTITNINIPRSSGVDVIQRYDVTLVIPKSFGPKVFVSPIPKLATEEGNNYIYSFDRERLTDQGISATFGKYQALNYNLKYQLKNDTVVSAIQEIALPPDIKDRQQVNHVYLNPQPNKIYDDDDGNLIAQYVLQAKENLEVELVGTARLSGKQINPEYGGAFQDIPKSLINDYTKQQKFWETQSKEIQSLKSKLFDKELNVSQNAQKIYKYIIDTFEYDFAVVEKDFVERKGAVQTIKDSEGAACMEFTDVFIATARAMGIPAREINGYAVNTSADAKLPLSIKLKSGDLLHAWPEYYDPNFGWVPVDPTWGDTSGLDYFTKLDTNHFAFVVKGNSSEFPLPAGLYRIEEEKSLVSVELPQDDSAINFDPKLALFKTISLNPLQIFKNNQRFNARNNGGTYIYNVETSQGPVSLLPYETKSVYLPKSENNVTYENINGEKITAERVFLNNNPIHTSTNLIAIILSILLALVVCSSVYYFVIVKGILKKRKNK